MDDVTRLARCARCGTELAADAPGKLCPVCLFALAAPADEATISTDATRAEAAPEPATRAARPRNSRRARTSAPIASRNSSAKAAWARSTPPSISSTAAASR